MPTISDKLKLETAGGQTVRLWPEGAFFKAYERSAYLFVTRLRPYEVRRRYVEAAGGDVVTTAFPRSVLSGLGVEFQEADDGHVAIRIEGGVDEQQFQQWRDQLPLPGTQVSHLREQPAVQPSEHPQEEPQVGHLRTPGEARVLARINGFNLAAATPLDCMMMLSELQQLLRQGHG